MALTFTFDCPTQSNMLVWTTVAGKETTLQNAAGTLEGLQEEEEILFTVMTFAHESPDIASYAEQIGPVLSVAVKIGPGGADHLVSTREGIGSLVLSGPGMVDITEELALSQYDAVVAAQKDLSQAIETLQIKKGERGYASSAIVESDWVRGGKFILSPGISGWPQANRIRFDIGVYWTRALAFACHLLAPDLVGIRDRPGEKVLDVLLVATLTALAGNYPLLPESRDDRGVGAIKLDLNRDCDDMALTVCAAFNHMKANAVAAMSYAGCTDFEWLANKLHCHLHVFAAAATIVCEANGTVAVPGKPMPTPCGHVFVILCRQLGKNMLVNGLVVEATRPSSPYASTIASHTTASGKQAFRRSNAYAPGDKGVASLKPLHLEQYIKLFMVHTAVDSYLCTMEGAFGVSLANMLSGGGEVFKIPCSQAARYTERFDKLSHKPRYEQVDDACEKHGWSEQQLGLTIDGPLTYPSDHIKATFRTISNPRASTNTPPKCYYITRFIAYCFTP
jgi:hypothetical protein